MTALLLSLWLALDVQGTLTCPTPNEVSQHLARLLPESGKAEQAPHAYLSGGEGFVTVELLGPEGGLLAERRLDRSASCAEMAEALAVILAAWQAKLSPTVVPTVIEPSAPAVAATAPGLSPPAPEVASKQPFLFDAGLGALTSFVGRELAFGGKLEAVLSPFAYGLGFHGAVTLSSTHKQTISSSGITAQAQWLRPALLLGPNLRLQGNRLALDIHADAVLALLNVKGSGLKESASDTTMQFGLAAGLRGLWTWSRVAVWVGADLFGYPGQDNLTVGPKRVDRLPHLEIQISLGMALGRFR